MIAPVLKKGDGVRIVAPAESLAQPWISEELKALACQRLEELGLVVSFGKHVNERDELARPRLRTASKTYTMYSLTDRSS